MNETSDLPVKTLDVQLRRAFCAGFEAAAVTRTPDEAYETWRATECVEPIEEQS